MVNIVGAGLAGSILKRVLDQNKIKNRIFDMEKPWRASIISENIFSLSWMGTLGNTVFKNGLKTLESVTNIGNIKFKTKAGHNTVLHVHPDNILVKDYLKGFCLTSTNCVEMDGKKYPGLVVDCRGYWTPIEDEEMLGLAGQGLFIKGKLSGDPIMNFVAPYVHQKLFQWDDKRVWYGDSTCIEFGKYFPKKKFYTNRCMERADALLNQEYGWPSSRAIYKPVYGVRPTVKGKKGHLVFKDGFIINTGGWKCGLIIYSDHAQKILKHIQNL